MIYFNNLTVILSYATVVSPLLFLIILITSELTTFIVKELSKETFKELKKNILKLYKLVCLNSD